jgi:hypothetical protein
MAGKKKNADTAPPTIEDTIRESLAQGSAGQHRKKALKGYMKAALAIIGVLFLIWFYNWLFEGRKGGTGFALCRTFLELQVRYPQELRLSYVRPMSRTLRIWYTEHDAFGQTRYDAMDCTFKQDPERGMMLDKVTINRREMDPDIIDRFNKSIPAVMAYPPDLTYPAGLPDNLRKLRLNQ